MKALRKMLAASALCCAAMAPAQNLPPAANAFDRFAIQPEKLELPGARREALEAALRAKDWRRAEALLWDEAAQRPHSSEVLQALGEAHFFNQRYFAAARALYRAEKLSGLDERRALMLATAYIALEKRHWARPLLHRLMQEHPKNPTYPHFLAGVYLSLQWFAECQFLAERTVQLDPRNVPAHVRLGECLEGMGKPEQAMAVFENAVALAREENGVPAAFWAPYHLGRLRHSLGEMEGAREALQQAAEFPGTAATVHFELGVVLRKLGELEAAAKALRKAAEIDPADPKPHYALVQVYRRLGDERQARRALNAFRELSSDY